MALVSITTQTREELGVQFGFTLDEIRTLNDAMHSVWGAIAYDCAEMLECQPCEVDANEIVELVCDAGRMNTFSDMHDASKELLARFNAAMRTTGKWDELPLAIWRS